MKLLQVSIFTIGLIVYVSSIKTAAQAPSYGYDFRLSEFAEKLPLKTTTALLVSNRGELWIGTQEGIHAFNGIGLQSYYYDSAGPENLRSDFVTAFAEDSRGNLYVGTRGGGVHVFDRAQRRFTVLRHNTKVDVEQRRPITKNVFALYADSDNRLWVGGDGGVQIVRVENGFIDTVTTTNERIGLVSAFAENEAGVWAASGEIGVAQIDAEGRILERIANSTLFDETRNRVETTGIGIDSDGDIWVWSLQNGLSIFDPKSGLVKDRLFHTEQQSSDGFRVLAWTEPSRRQIWLGTTEGLFVYRKQDRVLLKTGEEELNRGAPAVLSFAESRDKTVWLGTFYGPVAASPKLFRSVSTLNSRLSSDSINAFSEGDNGVWIGTENGLNLYENGSITQTINEFTTPKLSNTAVMALLTEEDGIWVGTYFGGLNFIDRDTGQTTVYRAEQNNINSIGSNGITSIIRSKSGSLIVGTYGGGLSILDEQSGGFRNFKHEAGRSTSINSNAVIALYQDSLGVVYVGTESGLALFDEQRGAFTQILSKDGTQHALTGNFVWAFFEDSNQDLWIGTNRGGPNIWRLADRRLGIPRFFHLPETRGTQLNSINGIAQDREGFIWLSHNAGLTRLSSDLESIRHFGPRDGLVDSEFNVGAFFTDSEGQIYFGGNRGFNIIENESLPGDGLGPRVSIAEIRVMNERIPRDFQTTNSEPNEIVLSHTDTLLEVDFFSDSLSSPDAVSYAYKLEGLTDDWVIGADRHSASFTTLPTGSYTLRMASAGASGQWNWNGGTLSVHVLPPPWKSVGAYILYIALAIGLIIYTVRRQRLRFIQQEQARLRLEEMVRERTTELQIATTKAEAANEAKSQFLATMSHEIRTPMHGVLGTIDLLMRTSLDTTQKRYASVIKSSGESLLSMINDILDFSKLEASKVELDKSWFNFNTLIDDICQLQSPVAQSKGLSILKYPLPETESTVYADQKKIGQCMTNLLGNAIKFTPKGNVLISATLNEASDHDNSLVLVVSDEGIGMNDETRQKVFERFTQADPSTTRRFGGTGLGLSITKQFVELMSGDISVVSEPNVGTTMTITLPVKTKTQPMTWSLTSDRACIFDVRDEFTTSLAACLSRYGVHCRYTSFTEISNIDRSETLLAPIDREALVQENIRHLGARFLCYSKTPNLEHEGDHFIRFPFDEDWIGRFFIESQSNLADPDGKELLDFSNIRALVAEDMQVNQQIIETMLLQLGIECVLVNDGNEAVSTFSNGDFDVVFMDCQMPNKDGFQASREIRDLEGRAGYKRGRAKIIALTAGTSEREIKMCLDSGMDALVGKPFSLDSISTVIRKTIQAQEPSTDAVPRPLPVHSVDPSKNTSIDGVPALDTDVFDTLLEISGGNVSDLFDRLVKGYRAQLAELLADIQRSAQRNDAESIRKSAHAIKSMSANIGANRIQRIFGEIEKEALVLKEWQETETLEAQVYTEFDTFLREANARISDMAAT